MSQSYVFYERKSKDIEFHDRRQAPSKLQCMPHLHHELELVLMLSGTATAYADSVRATLGPGDVFLSFPNQIHHFESTGPENFMLFIIKPEQMPDLSDLFHTGTPHSPVITGAGRDEPVRKLFDALGDACRQPGTAGKEYLLTLRRGYLLALFSELLSRMTVTRLSMGDSGALRSIVSFCTQNFSEDLSLSMLEEKLHLNKFYISHLFGEKLDMRFNDYINSLRIAEACRLLLGSKLSITEISEQVGFNTLRTFNRAFMKQMGCSPSAYRKSDYEMRTPSPAEQMTPASLPQPIPTPVPPAPPTPPAPATPLHYGYMYGITGGCCEEEEVR